MNKYLKDRNTLVFILLFVLSCFYILPIILADRYYSDDLGRSLYGYSRWKFDGRPLGNVVMHALNFGSPLLDLSPIIQILSIFALSISLTVYAKKYFDKGSECSVAVALFLFIGNPFFIENLSYKYDSLVMALSFSALIICFHYEIDRAFKVLMSFILILASLSLYQASIGIFFIFTIIEMLHGIYDNKEPLKTGLLRGIVRCSQFFAAYIVYSKIIFPLCSIGGYSGPHSQVVAFKVDSIHIFMNNFRTFVSEIFSVIHVLPIVLILFYILMFIGFVFKVAKERRFNVSIIVISGLAPVCCFLFSFIHLCILQSPVFYSRVLMSFSGFMLFLAFCSYIFFKKYSTYALIPLVWLCFFYSYSYSSATSAQKRLDSLVASSVYYDVSHYNVKFKKLSIIGRGPEAIQHSLIAKRLPIMNYMIPIYIDNSGIWGGVYLKNFLINGKMTDPDDGDFLFMKENKPFAETREYKIYANKDKMILVFNKQDMQEDEAERDI